MFHIKWWVVVAIKTSCFHMYNTFECHFKPNQKLQSDMTDPVVNHQIVNFREIVNFSWVTNFLVNRGLELVNFSKIIKI